MGRAAQAGLRRDDLRRGAASSQLFLVLGVLGTVACSGGRADPSRPETAHQAVAAAASRHTSAPDARTFPSATGLGEPVPEGRGLKTPCDQYERAFEAAAASGGNCTHDADCGCYTPLVVSGGNGASDVKTAKRLRDLKHQYLQHHCPEVCVDSPYQRCLAKCESGRCVLDRERMDRDTEQPHKRPKKRRP